MRLRVIAAAVAMLVGSAACSTSTTNGSGPNVILGATPAPQPTPVASSAPAPLASFRSTINNIIVISQENWSFDALYGFAAGANGYNTALSLRQVDANGNPLTAVPQPLNGGKPDTRFPASLPVAPYNIAAYADPNAPGSAFTGDPNHNFYLQQYEIDGGRMDRFLALGANPATAVSSGTQGGLPFGYYDVANTPAFVEGQLAKQYALLDNFHQSTFGGSFINNLYAICACIAVYPNPPSTIVESVDASGNPVQLGSSEGRVTPDNYAVNTIFPSAWATYHGATYANGASTGLPPQTQPNIGDRLSAAGVPWTFYSGGWNGYLAGQYVVPNSPIATFQPHHQSFTYFANMTPGSANVTAHIKDDSQFLTDLASGNLPPVSFIKAIGANNEHPGYTNLITGQMYVANLVNSIQMSPIWKNTMIVIYYDEAGGHYDHVPPQPLDRWGPSMRVPAIVISPWVKKGIVDHNNYEVVSILNTIEQRFGLQPLTSRDANAQPLLGMFDFTQPAPSAVARRPLSTYPRIDTQPAQTVRKPDGHIAHTELDD